MKISKPVLSCILLLQLILVAELGAQTPSASLKFSCASWDWIDGPPVFYLAGSPKKDESMEAKLDRLEEVDIPEMTRSMLYEFKGGRQIGFYHKGTNAAGEATLETVASVTLPAGWTRVLLVFFPGETKGSYRIFSLRDDRAHAPYGSYQLVNLSEHQLSGFLDREKIALKPKGKSIIKLSGDEPRPINFGVWTTIDGKQKWLQRNTLTYRPKKYLVYFFYAKKDGQGRLKVSSKGIVDFLPPPVVDGGTIPEPDESEEDSP